MSAKAEPAGGNSEGAPWAHALWVEYFELLMDFEGEVLTDDPDDPGGRTKYGIDARSNPGVDIARLTRQQAERMYLEEWRKSLASRLPSPLSYAFFDAAVNMGERQAVRLLQRAVGVRADGIAGPITIGAVMAAINAGEMGRVLVELRHAREKFYRDLAWTRPTMAKFLRGWLRRSERMHQWAGAYLRGQK